MIEALKEKHPEGLEAAGIAVPERSWIELQFSPIHMGRKSSLRHSGMSCLMLAPWLVNHRL